MGTPRKDWKKKETQHTWAPPSLAELKRLMMMVREQREEAKAVARIARQDMVREYSHSALRRSFKPGCMHCAIGSAGGAA
jgi:hypothetical protein